MIPAFYDLLPLQHVTEDGIAHGVFGLTSETWLVAHTQDNQHVWATIQAVDGPQEITIVFSEERPVGEKIVVEGVQGPFVGEKDLLFRRDCKRP